MLKRLLIGVMLNLCFHLHLSSHCQMPCGIYHDEMVFDQVDQFIETTVKGISVMEENPFVNVQDRNTFIRWVMQKEKSSDEIAQLITIYFLQQKIKPGEEDTAKRVLSAHRLLFYLVKIKQTADYQVVNDFYEEWENFKLMFHIEGYKCKVSQTKLKKWAEKKAQIHNQKTDPKALNEHYHIHSNEKDRNHYDHHHHEHEHDHHHDDDHDHHHDLL